MWKVRVVDVAKKVSNDMILKQIMKNWKKNVTRQKFYTVFSKMFEFKT